MDGKVVMVTGGSWGIGKETTKGLASLGAQVVSVCRDMGRCEAAMEEVRQVSGSRAIEMMKADLSSQEDIHNLAQEFKAQHDRLDVLINNAAIVPRRRQVTVDGIELQLAVNHLAPFLLTHLLLDVLVWSAPSRIITLSSGTHPRGRIDLDDIQAERRYKGFRRYSDTKLMNILFSRALARRLEGTGVTVNAITPGFIYSGLSRDFSAFSRGMVWLIAGRPEQGGRKTVYVASSPELEDVTGVYFKDNRITPPADLATDDALAERLWKVSEELTSISTEELILKSRESIRTADERKE
jgi:NAD(P)-dependent dehydrogenase (short-subunit alcohol dehydrogenase family)